MNDKQTLTLEAGKYYRTRNGRKAHVAGKNPFEFRKNEEFCGHIDGYGVASWLENGNQYNEKEDDYDLISEWVEPKRIKGWVAIEANKQKCVGSDFIGTEVAFTSHVLATREEAQQRYGGSPSAIIQIDVLEGEGL